MALEEASLKRKTALTGRPNYHTSIVVYRTLWVIINALMRVVYRYRASGRKNMPRSGPVIIVVNHLHLVDPGAVVGAVSRQIVTLAADKWRIESPLIHWFLKRAGAIFVNRGEVDRNALRQCLDVLQHGLALAIAPEGTRSRTGQLQRAKAGVAYIARQADAVIVPIGAWGQEHLSDWRRLHRPSCHTVIGKPFRLDLGEGRVSTERLQQLADATMIQVARLLPPEYRGYYANQVAALGPDELPAGIIPVVEGVL